MLYKLLNFFPFYLLIFISQQGFTQKTNQSLTNFVEKKRESNQNRPNGFSILLYNGNEKSARKVHQEFQNDFPNIAVFLKYSSPYWKVTTKLYSSRLKAERISISIKDTYPNVKIL